jgi:hypothetical protein
MRKMKFFSVSAALFAVGMLVTSCWTSDDPVSPGGSGSSESPKTTVVTDIDGAKYSVKATSNLAAKYTISSSDEVINGTSATFGDIEASSVTVTVEYTGADAAEYVNAKQTAKVDFSSETPSASLNFVFVKTSDPVSQAAAKSGTPVKNTDISVTKASIEGLEGIGDIGVTGDFSITVYKKATGAENTEDITKGKKFDLGGYVLNCQPDGAVFGTPVTLKVFVGTGLNGMTLKIKNGSETVSGTVDAEGYASFAVSHFSDWVLSFPFEVLEDPATSTDLIKSLTVNAVTGENLFSYTKKVGFDIELLEGDAELFPFVVNMAKGVFGDLASSLDEDASFTVEGAGVADISVFQDKRLYKLSYEGFVFNVTRYENVAYTITINGVTKTEHSGGSGK